MAKFREKFEKQLVKITSVLNKNNGCSSCFLFFNYKGVKDVTAIGKIIVQNPQKDGRVIRTWIQNNRKKSKK